MTYKQEPPFALQIELVEGCSLRCAFCGLQGIRRKAGSYRFMSAATVGRIVEELARLHWTARIEFAMHGEPSVHPRLTDVIARVRAGLPKASLMMLTNGTGFLQDTTRRIDAVLDAGLNTLGIDRYEGVPWADKILATYSGKYSITNVPPTGHGVRRVGHKDIIIGAGIHSALKKSPADALCNHCGAAAPLNALAAGKRCAKPFRELAIRWDGHVALCCNDFRGVCKAGSVLTEPLDKLWNGPVFNAARCHLYHGLRTVGTCQGCDALSTRVGLLPDKLGKQALPKPTPQDRRTLLAACSGVPYTAPVRRPWEPKGEER